MNRLINSKTGVNDNPEQNVFPFFKTNKYLFSDSLNTSPNLFTLEQEGREQQLYNKFEKLNLQNTTPNALSNIPDWFQEQYEVLGGLGRLQEQGSFYPNTYEVPNNVIRQEQLLLNSQNDMRFTEMETKQLRDLIFRLAPPQSSTSSGRPM